MRNGARNRNNYPVPFAAIKSITYSLVYCVLLPRFKGTLLALEVACRSCVLVQATWNERMRAHRVISSLPMERLPATLGYRVLLRVLSCMIKQPFLEANQRSWQRTAVPRSPPITQGQHIVVCIPCYVAPVSQYPRCLPLPLSRPTYPSGGKQRYACLSHLLETAYLYAGAQGRQKSPYPRFACLAD